MLEETASPESTGDEVDAFRVDGDSCRLVFEPQLGDILPGRCETITVRLSAVGSAVRERSNLRQNLTTLGLRQLDVGVTLGGEGGRCPERRLHRYRRACKMCGLHIRLEEGIPYVERMGNGGRESRDRVQSVLRENEMCGKLGGDYGRRIPV